LKLPAISRFQNLGKIQAQDIMFTALVFVGEVSGNGASDHEQRALMQTLNALIPAVVEGLVRDLIIIGDASDQRLVALADQCGCGIANASDLDAVLQAARCDWVLAFQAGAVPESGWQEAVESVFASASTTMPDAFRFKRSPLSPQSLMAKLFSSNTILNLGVIAKRSALLNQKGNIETKSKALQPQSIAAFTRVANARPSAA
jgi:hypothetical protein